MSNTGLHVVHYLASYIRHKRNIVTLLLSASPRRVTASDGVRLRVEGRHRGSVLGVRTKRRGLRTGLSAEILLGLLHLVALTVYTCSLTYRCVCVCVIDVVDHKVVGYTDRTAPGELNSIKNILCWMIFCHLARAFHDCMHTRLTTNSALVRFVVRLLFMVYMCDNPIDVGNMHEYLFMQAPTCKDGFH